MRASARYHATPGSEAQTTRRPAISGGKGREMVYCRIPFTLPLGESSVSEERATAPLQCKNLPSLTLDPP